MSLLVQGTEAFQAKNYAEAIALFTRAIEDLKNNIFI